MPRCADGLGDDRLAVAGAGRRIRTQRGQHHDAAVDRDADEPGGADDRVEAQRETADPQRQQPETDGQQRDDPEQRGEREGSERQHEDADHQGRQQWRVHEQLAYRPLLLGTVPGGFDAVTGRQRNGAGVDLREHGPGDLDGQGALAQVGADLVDPLAVTARDAAQFRRHAYLAERAGR